MTRKNVNVGDIEVLEEVFEQTIDGQTFEVEKPYELCREANKVDPKTGHVEWRMFTRIIRDGKKADKKQQEQNKIRAQIEAEVRAELEAKFAKELEQAQKNKDKDKTPENKQPGQ